LGGHPGTLTSNNDRQAGHGVLFKSEHCAAPLCKPSRTALMLGRRPSSTGVYENSQPYSGPKALAGPVSLNQHMKDNGHQALGCGKIYHGTYGAFAHKQGWHE